jgi:hypothetical protein
MLICDLKVAQLMLCFDTILIPHRHIHFVGRIYVAVAKGLLATPRMIGECMWNIGGMVKTEENRKQWDKNLSLCHVMYHKFHQDRFEKDTGTSR